MSGSGNKSTAGSLPPAASDPPRTDGSGPGCERCGRPDALRIADSWICPACYEESGACCPEFGAADLWEDADERR